jgi:hypothetical protein
MGVIQKTDWDGLHDLKDNIIVKTYQTDGFQNCLHLFEEEDLKVVTSPSHLENFLEACMLPQQKKSR